MAERPPELWVANLGRVPYAAGVELQERIRTATILIDRHGHLFDGRVNLPLPPR